MKQKTYQIVLDGIVITVTKKRIKNMYLRIKKEDGMVLISAPYQMSDLRIRRFAEERLPWIREYQKKYKELKQQNDLRPALSAAAVISPMLITFLGMEPYMAVGIALSSDVLASAVSAYTYGKNKNLDIRNGVIMMVSVLIFTVIGSYISSLVPSTTMGNFSVFMTFLLGIKFIVKPVMTTKESMAQVSAKKRAIQSVVCGVIIGFICGFIGAGGGMMMLLILTSVLGYELKTAVGTSVFIMTFTALTGAVSHFAIGGAPDWTIFLLCVVFTFLWARIASVFANKATPKTLNRATGVILVVLGIVVLAFSLL